MIRQWTSMTSIETTHAVPLSLTADGTIRVIGTRVSLDSIVHHFKLGATPEQIAHKFPSLGLADIYAVISYYLGNCLDVEDYLARQEADEAAIRDRIESDTSYQADMANLRQRLLVRSSERTQ